MYACMCMNRNMSMNMNMNMNIIMVMNMDMLVSRKDVFDHIVFFSSETFFG
jgi:hypothetical protein